MIDWQAPTPEQIEEEIKLAAQLLQDDLDMLWNDPDILYVPSFWDKDEESWDEDEEDAFQA